MKRNSSSVVCPGSKYCNLSGKIKALSMPSLSTEHPNVFLFIILAVSHFQMKAIPAWHIVHLAFDCRNTKGIFKLCTLSRNFKPFLYLLQVYLCFSVVMCVVSCQFHGVYRLRYVFFFFSLDFMVFSHPMTQCADKQYDQA